MKGMDFSSSAQNSVIAMACFWLPSALADIRCSLACYMTWLKYSGYNVLRMLKKYSRGGPLPLGKTAGKKAQKSGSFLNSGHNFFVVSLTGQLNFIWKISADFQLF